MTTYRQGETVVRRVEFAAEAGSDIGTVNKVQAIAWANYCTRTGTKTDSVPDDWCRVNVTDDEIVFAFTVEHKPHAAEEAVVRVQEAHAELTRRELQHSGGGREGHLNQIDLMLIVEAIDGAGVA